MRRDTGPRSRSLIQMSPPDSRLSWYATLLPSGDSLHDALSPPGLNVNSGSTVVTSPDRVTQIISLSAALLAAAQ